MVLHSKGKPLGLGCTFLTKVKVTTETNALAYHSRDLITVVKSIIIHALVIDPKKKIFSNLPTLFL